MLIRTGFGGQLSGSVGGVVASHNAGGAYLRNRSVPTNPNSLRQQLVRGSVSAAAGAWHGLSVGARASWAAYAAGTPVTNRLGESIILSGWNMFFRSFAFYAAGDFLGTMPTAAPVTPGLATLAVDSVSVLSVASGITVNCPSTQCDDTGVISIGPPLSVGTVFFGGPYTAWLTVSDLSAIDATPTAGNQSINRYGLPVAGERRPVRVAGAASDGKLGGSFETIVTVTA